MAYGDVWGALKIESQFLAGPLGGLWVASGWPLGSLWGPLGSLWVASGEPLGGLWGASGPLGGLWVASGGVRLEVKTSLVDASRVVKSQKMI